MATEDKLSMSLDAMIAKSSKSQARKPAGGRKFKVGGKPAPKILGSSGKKTGTGAKTRTIRVNSSKGRGAVQKRTSAPRPRVARDGPNPNDFLRRDVDSDISEAARYDEVRPRLGIENIQKVRSALDGPGKWEHDMYDGPTPSRLKAGNARSRLETGFTLQISNLDHKVSKEDMEELFREFGRLLRADVAYDRTDRSRGRAEVVYEKRADALAAQKKYNKVCLDGKPMHIELVGPPAGGRTVEALSSGIRVSRNAGGGRAGSGNMRSVQRVGGRGGNRRTGSQLGRGVAAMDED